MHLIRGKNNCRGQTLVEFSLVAMPLLSLALYFVDFGMAFYRYSTLTHTTSELTRYLAVELGSAWEKGEILQPPWNGSCNAFLEERGNDFLAQRTEPGYSMNDTSDSYYFGTTLGNNTALLTDPDAPYAILRIVGTREQRCLTCALLHFMLKTEGSAVVEYHSEGCNDY